VAPPARKVEHDARHLFLAGPHKPVKHDGRRGRISGRRGAVLSTEQQIALHLADERVTNLTLVENTVEAAFESVCARLCGVVVPCEVPGADHPAAGHFV
jgi:hypothetical protein